MFDVVGWLERIKLMSRYIFRFFPKSSTAFPDKVVIET